MSGRDLSFPAVLALLAVSALVSILATILLFPFWSWFEAATGIESVGHSGPAEWCYAAVFVLVGAIAFLLAHRRRAGADGASR